MQIRRLGLPALALVAGFSLTGCAGLSDTQQRTMTGGGIGAAGGALIGSMTGSAGMGALIGAGVGAAGGYVYDQSRKREEQAYRRGVQEGRSTSR